MKKAKIIKNLATEIVDCIYDNELNRDEATKYINDILCEVFRNTIIDYPKSQKCEHGLSIFDDCDKCDKL